MIDKPLQNNYNNIEGKDLINAPIQVGEKNELGNQRNADKNGFGDIPE